MADVAREVHGCRAALAKLALDEITITQRLAEASEDGVGQRRLQRAVGRAPNDAPRSRTQQVCRRPGCRFEACLS
jgi:predicted kinase